MRIFTAVSLPETRRKAVWETLRPCRDSFTGIKWVAEENLHLTLRFFGEVSPEELERIKAASRTAARSLSPFPVSLGGAGSFPERGLPRVLWVGLEGGREEFLKLGSTVEKAYAEAGLGRSDKPLSPHVTVGRVKGRSVSRKLGETIRSLTFPADNFSISAIEVFESRLRPRGPLYVALARYELGEG